MNARLLLCSLMLLAACGGGESAAPNPVPPPPPAPTPATVAVAAGDAQVAEPGTAVATAPAVVVRSSNGTAVANVAVTFAVDSGGGTVTASSSTTDAAGVATPGSWRLGTAEGPQVLIATVGGIPAVRIRATARVSAVTIGSGTLAMGGGTITVSRPGLFSGTTLTLPAGAVSGTATVSLSLVSTAGLTLKRGITTNAPGLVITSTVGTLARPARIRIPTPTRPDRNMVLLAFDSQTGQLTMLPQQVADATGISARLPAFNTSIVDEPVSSAISGAPSGLLSRPRELFSTRPSRDLAAASGETPLTVIMASVPPEALNRDYDSGFQVQRDNWDFTNFAVAWLPFLPFINQSDRETGVYDMSTGMVATSLWYFKTQRGAPPLYKRFRLQSDQPRSNKSGIRWAALASQLKKALNTFVILDDDDPFKDQPANMFSWGNLLLLRQAFYVSDDRPVPILLYGQETADKISKATDNEASIAIATRITGNEVEIILPENSDATYRLKISEEGGMQPLTVLLFGTAVTFRSFVPILARPLLDVPSVASNFAKVVAGTVGDAEGWPVPELHWEKGKLDEENLYLAEPLLHYWECPRCPDFGLALPGAPEGARNPQAFQVGKITDGTMAALPRIVRGAITWNADSVTSDKTPTRAGHHLLLNQDEDQNGAFLGWLDWRTVTYRRVSLLASPATVTFSKDTTINVSLAPSQPLPAGTTYSWILRTDAGRDSVGGTAPSHARNLKTGQKGKLLVIAHEKDTKRPIARDSITIESIVAEPYWRITTISDPDSLLDPNELSGSSEFYTMMQRIFAVPASAVIAIESEAGNKSAVRLRVLPSSTWTTINCCPPTLAPLPGELRQSLGEMPRVTYNVGPFFAAYNVTQWSQSTTDLGAGTVTGTYVDGGLEPRKIEKGGTQMGPRNYIRITATRNGTAMSGTIAVIAWFQDEKTGEVGPDEPTIFRFPFTASRIK